MATKLTDTAITRTTREAAENGKRLDLSDAGQLGLWLRITPRGVRSWVLVCRDAAGAARRFPLGSYPAMGISDARTAARSLRTQVRMHGADPIADRRKERADGQAARAGVGTLDALLRLYSEKEPGRAKSWPEANRRIRSVFGPLLEQPLARLADRDLQLQADRWPAEASASSAVRYLRPVLKWGERRGYVTGLGDLVQPATPRRRDRVLARDELARMFPAFDAAGPCGGVMRFALLTLARREEIAGARWADVDLTAKTWTIPQTKNGTTHIVPLARQAVALLRTRMPEAPDPTALVFGTATGGRLGNWDRATKKIQAASKTAGWHRHDLRRTAATMLGDMGELPDIIEAALNHASIRNTLAATYNRSRYRPQVAVALQRLADALEMIESTGDCADPTRCAAE